MYSSDNLFLISTPLQLINALEAKMHFQISNDSSVVIVNAYSTNLAPIKVLLANYEWREIYFIEDSVENQKKHEDNLKKKNPILGLKKVFQSSSKFNKLIKQFSVVDALFIGYYLGLENIHFANSVKYRRLILLDDGIATLEVNRRRKANISFTKTWNVEYLFRVLFKKLVLRYKLEHPHSVIFFTSYKIDPSPRDLVEKNEYSEIRRMTKAKESSEEVLFLGQPLSEEMPKILTEDTYLRYLDWIVKYIRPHKMIYIPHRDEDKVKLSRLQKLFNVEIRFIHMPFELYLMQQKKLPKCIVGVITSAIPNCKSIFGDSVDIIAIRIHSKDVINKALLTTVEETYSYFELISDEKLQVISVE